MKVCFLENTEFSYNSKDLYNPKLRGAETVLINLSSSIKQLGHKVTIINNCPKNENIDGIEWKNINHYDDNETFELAITNNDIRLFDKITANKKIAISHSLQSLEKFIRKKQILSYLKHKPKIVLLSDYHKKNRSKLLTLFGSFRLDWSVNHLFLEADISHNNNPDRAIFTSKHDRNLDMLLNIWTNLIYPKFNSAKLMVPDNNFNIHHKSIIMRNRGSQKDLIKDLRSSKVFLIPGHKAELFCLAAEEAKEMCLPIVTLGIGCLSERVDHGKTGFVAKNQSEFAKYTIDIFKDNHLYKELKQNLIRQRGKNNWNKTAKKLFDLI